MEQSSPLYSQYLMPLTDAFVRTGHATSLISGLDKRHSMVQQFGECLAQPLLPFVLARRDVLDR